VSQYDSIHAPRPSGGVLAYFHNDDPSLVLPVFDELQHISGEGGVLEFELPG